MWPFSTSTKKVVVSKPTPPVVPKHDPLFQMDRHDRAARMRGFTAVGGRKTRKGRKGKKATRRR